MLATVAGDRGYGRLWTASLEGWVEYRAKLDELIQEKLPRLHTHFANTGMIADLYAAKWFFTIYSNGFPFESTLRIWDVFLCEPHPKGTKMLFRVALAVLRHGERELLRMNDVTEMASHIKALPNTASELRGDKLIHNALRISLKTKELDKGRPSVEH